MKEAESGLPPGVPGCPGCAARDRKIAELEARIAKLEERIAKLEERIAKLAERLGQDSSNSGKPPPGSDSEDGRRFVERVLTAVVSRCFQKLPVLAFLRAAISTHRCARPAPSLLQS